MTTDPAIFIAPCSRNNNKSAIRYLRETVFDGISPEEYPEITELGYDEKTPVWGVVESKKATWDKMREGVDIVLFYSKSGVYTHLARIDKKYRNSDLAGKIWAPYEAGGVTTDPDDPWSLMFFLEDVKEVNIPADAVHDAFGYEMDYPLGFMRPTDERHAACRSEYGSILKFLNQVSTQEQLKSNVISDTSSGQTDEKTRQSTRRKRSNSRSSSSDENSISIEVEQDIGSIKEKSHRHEAILDLFEEQLEKNGFEVFETINSDLIGIRDDDIILAEAKTIEDNEAKQIRQAIGQLYEYRYCDIQLDDGLNDDPLMFLILDQKPSEFYTGFLLNLQKEGIHSCWVDDGEITAQSKFTDLLDDHRKQLNSR